ncbi:S-layer homology domain-containing protein [Lysinibacillus sp. NPDC096418]|uniref:S-layer homology domain-containing protein n=1 Tax=Lysinibacillus sp. NPDC096418 TaxID=3364138 RepID=UPI0038013CF9
MGKKIFNVLLCLMLIISCQLSVVLFVSPIKVEAASCGDPGYPECIQDLTKSSWLGDATNGFVVTGVPGNDGIDLFKYEDNPDYPNGYFFDADEFQSPKSIRISAGEGFTGGVFDLKTLTIKTVGSPYLVDDVYFVTIQGYDIAGAEKGNPVLFKSKAGLSEFEIPISFEGINSFVITASSDPARGAGIYDITFTQFKIDISDSVPPTVSTGAINTSNITTSGVTLDWTKATDNTTLENNLEYRVYQSSSSNIDTVSNMEANGIPLGSGYSKDLNSFVVSGLAPSTMYYFNVIVKDAYGNKSAYTMKQVSTPAPNKPPSSSNGSVNVNEGQVYTFNTTDFVFSDEDAGDVLSHIQMTIIPSSGQLFIDVNGNNQADIGEIISNGGTISKSDLDTGKLKYVTQSSTSSSFTFKVSDGKDYSTSTYMMTLVINAGPTVIISSNESNPTNHNPIGVKVDFSEPVTGFSTSGITVLNGTVTGVSGSGGSYIATISPTADGDVKINVPANVASDSGGAMNKAAAEFSITYDGTAANNIVLDNTQVFEKKPSGTIVGTINATDPVNSQETFTYSLQSGDVSSFTIDGNKLKTSAVFDYDTKNIYSITIRATDDAGNTFDKAFTIQILKNQSPTGSLTINGGANITNSTSVTLTTTAMDAEGEPVEMQFSNDGVTWSAWEPSASNKSWVMASGDGSKTVYMKLRDAAGNISNILTDTIVLDTTPPVVTGVTNNGTYNTSVTITFNEGTATLNGAAFTNGTIVSADGNYTLVVTDAVGNTTTVTFLIDKTAPQISVVSIKSNNVDPTKAKVGDTITLTITTNESIQTPIVTIASRAATVTQNGDTTKWQATYVMANGDSDGTIHFTVNVKDLAGNQAAEVTGTTDGSSVKFDRTMPTVQKVTMRSNNANPEVAKVGDIITLDIVMSKDVQMPVVTILGKAAAVSDKGDGDAKTWQASYTLQSGDVEGVVSFTIDYKDIIGNVGVQVTTVTSGRAVIFDNTAPTLTTVTMNSSNNDTTKAKVGDVITLNIVASEDINSPTVTIAGKSATINNGGDSDAKTWSASYTMQANDTDGTLAFTISYEDLIGNIGSQVTTVTTGTAITFDKQSPNASTVTIFSSNVDPTKAKVGDTVTLSFTTSESIQTPTVTIAGKAATVIQNGDEKTWQATYVIANGDSDGILGFTINFHDLVGNQATEVTGTTDGSSISLDGTKPTVQTVTMHSNNVNQEFAKVGDIVTLEIVTSEDVHLPIATIAGKAATVTDKGDGDAKTWQATYTLQSQDSDGPVSFTLDFQDLNGNKGLQVTNVTTGTIVLFDKEQPEVTEYYPLHNALDVLNTDNLILTFNENVVPVTGKNIIIKNVTENQIVASIEANDSNVTVLDGVVTVDPSADLAHNIVYSVEIDEGAFTDIVGNNYSGIVDHTIWNFTTKSQPTFTVIYDGNGAYGGKVPTDTNQYKTQATVSILGNLSNLVKSGYTFIGWNTKADGTGTTYSGGQTIKMGTANLMLYAMWDKNSSSDGGSGSGSGSSDGQNPNPGTGPNPTPGQPTPTPETPKSVEPTMPEQPKPTPTKPNEQKPTPTEPNQPEKPTTDVIFSDVQVDHWAGEMIYDFVKRGYITGYSDSTFRPNEPITRQHVALILTRVFQLSPKKEALAFKDIPTNHPYYGVITLVQQAGLFEGNNGNFNPNANMTRAQIAKVLAIELNLPVANTPIFRDVLPTHWAYNYINALAVNDISLGDNGYFKPEASLTRAQFVALLYRALNH